MTPILLVTDLFPPEDIGGSAELFHNVYTRIEGSSVTVMAPGVRRHAGSTSLRFLRSPDPVASWGMLNPASLVRYVRIASAIRLSSRDGAVVHCGRAIPEGAAALLARSTAGPRFMCWTHGEELATFKRSRELTLLMRQIHRRASALIANSRNTASALEAYGAPARRIHVVYPGVDTVRFRPGVEGAIALRGRLGVSDALVMLTVGRLERRKGHDLAIRAFASLRPSHPHLRYVIAGEGEERPRLQRIAGECGVANDVVFAGRIDAVDLPAYYAAADIFVHPNRDEDGDFEGFGIVFLEAAAAGLPIIGGKTGGVPEAVVENQTALLVGGTDVAELQEAIALLVADASLRRRMGESGRARAVSDFSWSRAARQVEEINAHVAA